MPNLTPFILLFLITLAQSSQINETFAYYFKAILLNKDKFDDTPSSASSIAEWTNLNSHYIFDNYFDNNQGLITTSSIFFGFEDKGFKWNPSFIIYDGPYLDQKVAYINFASINFPESINITDEANATIFFSDVSFTTIYNDNEGPHISTLRGSLSLFLVEKSTLKPPKTIDPHHLSQYTIQFMFMDHSSSFSLTTPFFYRTYPISTLNKIIVIVGACLFIILSICSRYRPDKRREVSMGALACLYIYPFYLLSFIVVWYNQQGFSWEVMLWFIPFGVAIFSDVFKNTIIIFNHQQFSGNYGFGVILAFILAFAFALLPYVGFVAPSLFLLPQVLFKFKEKRNNVWYKSLTMFEVGHWACMSLWILYVKLYPDNIFLLSPEPLVVEVFFGMIAIQLLMIAYIKFFVPGKEIFKYTFIEEDPLRRSQLLSEECAICLSTLKAEGEPENTEKLYKTPCGHTFHSECLLQWSEKKLVCPYCRKQLPDLIYPLN